MKYNASQWLKRFKSANGKQYCFLRQQIQKQTLDAIKELRYTTEGVNSKTIRICKDQLKKQAGQTKLVICTQESNDHALPDTLCNISIINMDCIDASKRLIDQGFNPAVLNMANSKTPGGGWKKGCGAQEESLYRRTTYHTAMDNHKSMYPIPTYAGIYSPDLLVFRSNESQGYSFLSSPYYMSFIAVAAVNRPKLESYHSDKLPECIPENIRNRCTDKKLLTQHESEKLKRKIRTICLIALKNGHDSLVLCPLGCGAFRNPPFHVACLMRAVLSEPAFSTAFKKVVISIIEDHNSKRNQCGNLRPFEIVFDCIHDS
jgi:uncharacterized protein (TIGR02452 family)